MKPVLQGGIKPGKLPPIFYAATNIGKSMFASSREKIEQHLIKQKARAVQSTVGEATGIPLQRCQYRTNSGLMCAAGCLIPDDKYKEEMEGTTARCIFRDFPSAFPSDIQEREVSLWQSYHDNFALLGHKQFSYGAWIEGNEEHHPTKFKAELAEWITTKDEW